MATSGRKPTPTHLKLLRGAEPHHVNHNEPKPPPLSPDCPDWLPPAAQEKWRELAPQLVMLGLFTAIDGTLFEKLCIAHAMANEAAARLAEDGLLTTDENGLIRKHPANQIWRDNVTLVARLSEYFGLSPSSRSRIHLNTVDEEDEFEDYLNGKPARSP